eukprot:2847532-Rhodomonas_salina.1
MRPGSRSHGAVKTGGPTLAAASEDTLAPSPAYFLLRPDVFQIVLKTDQHSVPPRSSSDNVQRIAMFQKPVLKLMVLSSWAPCGGSPFG